MNKTRLSHRKGGTAYLLLATVVPMALLAAGWAGPANSETILTPQSSGTISSLPELGILQSTPVGTDVHSSYFRTTSTNREFRRGFMEFTIPQIQHQIFSATLVLTESRGIISLPVSADGHELSYYQPADLVVDPSDFKHPTTPLVDFKTSMNQPPQTFSFDVTHLITVFNGTTLGFRVKLQADPAFISIRSFGTAFNGDVGSGLEPRIIVRTLHDVLRDSIQHLLVDVVMGIVDAGQLNSGQGTALIAKLEAAMQHLNLGNVSAANHELQAFINQANAFVNAGMLSPQQSQLLISTAQEILNRLSDS